MQKVTPFLWYEKDALKIAKFYASVFKGSKIKEKQILKNTPSGGTVEIITMELMGINVTLMSAGPMFKLNESFSMVIKCKTQKEIDSYWKKLTANGGEESMCGWLKDKYGLSWQIVPEVLSKYLADKDKQKATRVTQAFLQMRKFDIAGLKKAYDGK